MTLNIQELVEFSSTIVKEAGTLLREFKKKPLHLEEKKDHADLVTIADKKVEEFLVGKIIEKYPDHGILGEEGIFEGDARESDTVWVIDPIDGTTNFIHGFPYFGISVGITYKSIGIIGLVYNPSSDELFLGIKNKGAFINGEKVEINNDMKLKEALVSTSMFWQDPKTKNALNEAIIQLYKDTRGLRMVGGAAISLGEIAKGTLNAYIMPMLNPWDFAGGVIFLEEAGGIVTRLNGDNVNIKERGSLLASHPSIHQELIERFKTY